MRVFILPTGRPFPQNHFMQQRLHIFHSTNMFGCSGPVLLTLPIFTATISDTLNLGCFFSCFLLV